MQNRKDERIKIRRTWEINPRTRIKHSRKAYERTRSKREIERELERELDREEFFEDIDYDN